MPRTEVERLLRAFPAARQARKTELFADQRPVYIYGAGNVGRDLCRALTRHGVTVTGFLDRKATSGAAWEGVPLLAPDDPAITPDQRRQSHVVFGIFNRDTEMPPIFELLTKLGYGRITSFLEVHDHFAAELGDRFWLTSLDFYPGKEEPILAGYDLWSDEISRDLYAAVLRFRLTQSYEALPRANWDDQYFPHDLPAWPLPLRLADCGAYDGDTLRALHDRRLEIGAIAAFEPDPANFAKLADTARTMADQVAETLSLFPCGVGRVTAQIRFSAGQGSSSCISAAGETVIQCVALDDALPAFRPNLIKMDIEGAEYDALLGARRLIETHRPGLAISVYHQADHLWTIPLLIKSWLPGGRHHLRMHAYNAFELIYYWMP